MLLLARGCSDSAASPPILQAGLLTPFADPSWSPETPLQTFSSLRCITHALHAQSGHLHQIRSCLTGQAQELFNCIRDIVTRGKHLCGPSPRAPEAVSTQGRTGRHRCRALAGSAQHVPMAAAACSKRRPAKSTHPLMGHTLAETLQKHTGTRGVRSIGGVDAMPKLSLL